MKIAIVGNNTSDILNARGNLIEEMVKKGHEVLAIGNEDIKKSKIEKLGAKLLNIEFNRISVNPYKNIKYINDLVKNLKKEKVECILLYTPKPIICGSIAAKIAGIKKVYCLFAGLGYHYSINTFRTVIIRFFCNIGYRIACKLSKRVIFQNKQDKDELIRRRFLKPEKAFIIDGSGVNMNKFKKCENKIQDMTKLRFLMISRGLNVKGIKELYMAAETVHKKYPDIKFIHLGKFEDTYRDVKGKDKKIYEEHIEFKGKVYNVYDYIKDSNIAILPTYLREGIPRVLLEALAVGRPIITTNVRGCKETVIQGKNGYLVEPKNVEDLTKKILQIIELPISKIQEMSEESYKIAKQRFDVEIINKRMLEIMEL